MPKILVVEGLTDATFSLELLRKLYLHNAEVEYDRSPGRRNIPKLVRGLRPGGALLEVEFRNQMDGGEGKIPDAVRFLLTEDIREFAVAQDIDAGSPEQTLQSVQGTVYSHLGLNPPRGPVQKKIEVEGRTLSVIHMGLYQDDTLSALGVTNHAMEDYLIKLLLEDTGLRKECPELLALLTQILPVIRSYNGSFNASKELFQLIKPVVKHGFSDTGAVKSLFDNADPAILRRVLAPVLGDVELALVTQ